MKRDIKSMLPEEIAEALTAMGEKSFRGKQIFTWLARGAVSFEDMTNLSKALREKLSHEFYITAPERVEKQVSEIDGTVKYLWRLEDKNCIESVVMSYKHGNTVCISSQVGCKMGCVFCASTIGGLVRDLTPSEMLDQVIFSEKDSGMPISNIVLMGIGEPLDNFDNVLRFLEIVNNPAGVGIGMRHITISTCGITEMIDKLGDYRLQLTLSVSLHAPDDETRSAIMPQNRGLGIRELLNSCKRYFEKTGRRISFEYAMIDGVNDTERHAKLLADKMLQVGGHVNLIPLNHVEGRSMKPGSRENMDAFVKILTERRINVTIRRGLGGDIDASCGQLRRKSDGGRV